MTENTYNLQVHNPGCSWDRNSKCICDWLGSYVPVPPPPPAPLHITRAEEVLADLSFDQALVDGDGRILWSVSNDGDLYVNPDFAAGPLMAVTELWRNARLHQTSGVGGVFPALADALDALIKDPS